MMGVSVESSAAVSLLDVDPDFEDLISVGDRTVAGRLMLPVHEVFALREGADVGAMLARSKAFAAIVLDGMLVHRLRVADQVGCGCSAPGTSSCQRLTRV